MPKCKKEDNKKVSVIENAEGKLCAFEEILHMY